MKAWRFIVAVACWVLGLLGLVLVMAPIHWLFGETEVSGAAAAWSGAAGLLLIAVVLPMSFWWHRRRAAERGRKGFAVETKER